MVNDLGIKNVFHTFLCASNINNMVWPKLENLGFTLVKYLVSVRLGKVASDMSGYSIQNDA